MKTVELVRAFGRSCHDVFQHTYGDSDFKRRAHLERGDSDVNVSQWDKASTALKFPCFRDGTSGSEENEKRQRVSTPATDSDALSSNLLERSVGFRSRINAPSIITNYFGSHTGGAEIQQYSFDSRKGEYIVSTRIQLLVPFGESFHLMGRWHLRPTSSSSCIFEITMFAKYDGPMKFIFQAILEQQMANQSKSALEQWLHMADMEIEALPPQHSIQEKPAKMKEETDSIPRVLPKAEQSVIKHVGDNQSIAARLNSRVPICARLSYRCQIHGTQNWRNDRDCESSRVQTSCTTLEVCRSQERPLSSIWVWTLAPIILHILFVCLPPALQQHCMQYFSSIM